MIHVQILPEVAKSIYIYIYIYYHRHIYRNVIPFDSMAHLVHSQIDSEIG